MKSIRALIAVLSFAAASHAGWMLGVAGPTGNTQFSSNPQKYKILRVMTETSCAGAFTCATGSIASTQYYVFYVAQVGQAYSGEAIIIQTPARADSKLVIDQLQEAYREGWSIAVADHGSGTYETNSGWNGVTKIYRAIAGDRILVMTMRE